MVLPYFDYGDTIYGTATKTSNKLQLTADECLRFCSDTRPLPTLDTLRTNLKIHLMEDGHDSHLANIAFKISLQERYIDSRPIRTRAHNQRLIKTYRIRRTTFSKLIMVQVSNKWNAFPNDIRSLTEYTSVLLH